MANEDKKEPMVLGIHPREAMVAPNHRCPICSEANESYYMMAVRYPHTFLTIVGFCDFPYIDPKAKSGYTTEPSGNWTLVCQCIMCESKFWLHVADLDLYALLIQHVLWPFEFDPLINTSYKNWREQRHHLITLMGGG